MVELYALGIILRVAVCDPKAYDEGLSLDDLRELTIAKQQESISAIQRGYPCLEITNAPDVRTDMRGAVPECAERNFLTRGGHQTASVAVRDYAFIDHDVLHMEVVLKYHQS